MLLVTLSLTACQSAPTRLPIVRSELEGRFVFVGADVTTAFRPGVELTKSLYEISASKGAPTSRMTDYRDVSALVSYPALNLIGFKNSKEPHRGLFLVGDLQFEQQVAPTLPPSLIPTFSQAIYPNLPSAEKPLTVYPTQVVLSPDGEKVAGLNSDNQLCIARRDATRADRCETTVHACDGSTPSWSPDGKQIAFAAAIAADNGGCNLYELFLMDVASGRVNQLTDIPGPRIGPQPYGSVVKSGEVLDRWHKTNKPGWSPDGQWIAFTTYAGVGRIHPDGTGMSILTKGAGAVWSPDGTMIAYRVQRKSLPKGVVYPQYNRSWALYVSRADGTGALEIPVDPTGKLSVEDVVWTK